MLDFDEQQLQHYPDESKVPKGGWLSPEIAKRFRTKGSRMLITGFLYLMSCAFSFFLLYAFFYADVDNFRGLFSEDSESIHTLVWVDVIASGVSIISILIVEFGMIPGLWWDCCRMQHASKVYNTKVFEIADIDDDSNKQEVLQVQMANHQALSLTIVIPCYMPNEEDHS